MSQYPNNLPAYNSSPYPLIGRKQLLDDLLYGVLQREPESYAVIALSGFGKSTFLKSLDAVLAEHDLLVAWAAEQPWMANTLPTVKPIYLNFGEWNGDRVLQRIHSAISQELEAYGRAAYPEYQSSDTSARGLANLSETIGKVDLDRLGERVRGASVRFVLLLDDFDFSYLTITREDEQTLRRLLPTVPAIIATEEPWISLKRGDHIQSPLYRYIERQEPLPTFTFEETRELIRQVAERTGNPPLDAFTEEWVHRVSGGIPLLVSSTVRACYDIEITECKLQKIESDEYAYQILVSQLLSSYGLNRICSMWWEQLSLGEKEIMHDLSSRSDEHLAVAAVDIERLSSWQLIRADRDKYRVGSEIFSVFISSLGKHNPLKSSKTTVDDRLLAYLQEHPGELCSYAEVYRHVWGQETIEGRRLENALSRLRKRLGRGTIETVYNTGIRYLGEPARDSGQDHRPG